MSEQGDDEIIVRSIVLAGQENRGALQNSSEERYEAEIQVAGRPMVDYVLDALGGAEGIDDIVLVAPDSIRRPGTIGARVEGDIIANLLSGIQALPSLSGPVLVVTSDVPLLTSRMIDQFLNEAPLGVDVVYPIIEKGLTQNKFPDTKRTYVKLRDGSFTGGNMFLINPVKFLEIQNEIKVLLDHRKSPIRLARDIGVMTLVRLILGNLSIRAAERRVGSLLNIQGRALIFPYPEVGVDVDKPQDLALVESVLSV